METIAMILVDCLVAENPPEAMKNISKRLVMLTCVVIMLCGMFCFALHMHLADICFCLCCGSVPCLLPPPQAKQHRLLLNAESWNQLSNNPNTDNLCMWIFFPQTDVNFQLISLQRSFVVVVSFLVNGKYLCRKASFLVVAFGRIWS